MRSGLCAVSLGALGSSPLQGMSSLGRVGSRRLAGPPPLLPDLVVAETRGLCLPCPDPSSFTYRTRVLWGACWIGLLGSGMLHEGL